MSLLRAHPGRGFVFICLYLNVQAPLLRTSLSTIMRLSEEKHKPYEEKTSYLRENMLK